MSFFEDYIEDGLLCYGCGIVINAGFISLCPGCQAEQRERKWPYTPSKKSIRIQQLDELEIEKFCKENGITLTEGPENQGHPKIFSLPLGEQVSYFLNTGTLLTKKYRKKSADPHQVIEIIEKFLTNKEPSLDELNLGIQEEKLKFKVIQ